MANGKKRRKQKKRRKMKMDSFSSNSNSQVNLKTISCLVDDCCSPVILAPTYKNFKHNLIAKSKGCAFVHPSCITPYCSTPYQEINKPKLGFKHYQPPLIETTHIFNSGPTKRIRKRKQLGSCTVIVPASCLELKQAPRLAKQSDHTYAKAIMLEKAAEIIMPVRYYRSKRRWFTGASIVPMSCITNHNSVVKKFSPQPRKFSYPPPAEHKPSPPIIGPERHFMRCHKKYGDNNVIVTEGCIIQTKPVNVSSSYDWRKAFPKPIALEKVAEIVGPTVKIRTKKRSNMVSGFVPASCIIVQKEVPTPDIKRAVEESFEAEVLALAQEPTSTTDSDNNFYLLAVAMVVAVIIFAFVFSR